MATAPVSGFTDVDAAPGRRARTHRLFVLTDITSLEGGVLEPDDGQSMVRLMLYTNDIDVEGLAATSNLGHGQRTRPDLIRRVVDAYGRDFANLRRHDARYPHPDALRQLVFDGQPTAGPAVPVPHSIGPGRDTRASRALVRAADRDDPAGRPLWVTAWGGTADLAQALWSVRETGSAADVATFVSRIRVADVGGQDSTAAWIQAEFPELLYVRRRWGVRGMYRGGDMSLVSPEWVAEQAKPFGALGALYPVYDGGDIWSGSLGKVRGIKEGDTPSWLNLVGGGDPLDGWGGRLVETSPRRYDDDAVADAGEPPAELAGRCASFDAAWPRMAAVFRHRPAFQADFARRIRWCADAT